MLADVPDGALLAVEVGEAPGMVADGPGHDTERRRGADGTAGERVGQLAEEPRSTEAAPADDHAVAAGVPDHRQGVLGPPDVAVAEHGDRRHRRLQLGDGVPVGVTGVELLGGAGVEGDGGHALVLGDAAGVEEREVVVVDALAELDRHGHVAGGAPRPRR